jgi:DNA-binding GntR family transcriptional regulator
VLANAGTYAPMPVQFVGVDSWNETIDINLNGVFLTVKAGIRAMVERNEGGAVVITSSTAGLKGFYGAPAYNAAKHGVVGLMRSLALELAPNRTLRVPIMSADQFREITRIRINLEGLAAATAALRLTPEGIEKIEDANADFSREIAKAKPDGPRLIRFNMEFHFGVYQGAEMPMLLRMIEDLWSRIGPILNYDLQRGSRRLQEREPVDHHDRLLAAIKQRDAAAAAEALRGDIQTAADFIVATKLLPAAEVVPVANAA